MENHSEHGSVALYKRRQLVAAEKRQNSTVYKIKIP